MTIDANVRTPDQLFRRTVRYVVPAYQRRYVWQEKTQWKPLWEDVRRLADAYLELTSDTETQVTDDDVPKHFLGAVVLQQEVTPTGGIEVRRIIDGQQRLTTLQILLDAVQEVYESSGQHQEARRLERLVLNDELDTGSDDDARYKVWPTISDQEDFRYAMRNDTVGVRPSKSLIIDAHDYFKTQVAEWMEQCDSASEAAEGLRIILSRMLQMVVIDLDADAEPQIVFETLNARGTPLSQSDLVRNYMIFKARSEELNEDDFNRRWLLHFDAEEWRVEERFGALQRSRLEQFLYYWLVMRTKEQMRVGEVFARFRRYVDDLQVGIQVVADDLQQCAQIYLDIEEFHPLGPYGRWAPYFRTRKTLDISIDAPLLLWLFMHAERPQELDITFGTLESWFVRRSLMGRRIEGVDVLMLVMVNRLETLNNGESIGTLVVSILRGLTGERVVWASDQTFLRDLVEKKAFGRLSRNRLVYLLERLEIHLRTPRTERTPLPEKLQIEHIMPRSWQRHWPLIGETTDRFVDEREYREHSVDCLGNLTLVTRELNSSASNGAWARKREALDRHSVLFLNKDVIQYSGDDWTIADIEERSHRLAERAIDIWPGPDDF